MVREIRSKIGQRRNRAGSGFLRLSAREAGGRRGLFEHATIYWNRNGVGGLHDREISNAEFRGAEESCGKRREEAEAAGPTPLAAFPGDGR